MCGIAGIMTIDGGPPDGRVLDRLAEALGHRGPDGRGRYQSGGVGMVQNRLAIIDLETGDQPFRATGDDGAEVALMANAEIYNYVELAAHLPAADLKTKSDCEPPLHLYLRHGMGFAEHLRGMYAIAIHDTGRRRLVLARDPFGIKPLYYAETPAGFVFASEPQALVRSGLLTARLNRAARDELLQLQFTTGTDTAFDGIDRLPPGETITVESGRVVERCRLKALPAEGPRPTTRDAALKELDAVLNDAVGIHQRSDVPYGMFFSGGVDSSVLLAMMSRLNAEPVRAFTAGFPGAAVPDERDHARTVARAAGADHVEVAFTSADFWSLLPEIAAVLDDPAADYAALPSYKLASAVKAAGLKVVLTGEGGDEIFAGYGRYRAAIRPWPLARRMRRKGIFDGLGILRDETMGWRDGIAAAEAAGLTPSSGLTRLQAAQAADCAHWLPGDLLTKLDRCLMAHGVEGRVPFLDARLADFAFRLPDRLKVRRGRGKWLLRRWLETGLPASKPFTRKRGFTVPVGAWIAEKGRQLGPLVAAQPGVDEACRPGTVAGLFADAAEPKAGKAAWTLLFYALWHRTHMQGLPPAGGVFDTLGAKG